MLDSPPIEKIGIDELNDLVDLQIQEGGRIEFKSSMYRISKLPSSDRKSLSEVEKQKREKDRTNQIIEMLKDISSFSNAVGGDLLIGIKELDGVAADVVGFDWPNVDRLKQTIDQFKQSGIEPRPVIAIHAVNLEKRENCTCCSRTP